MSHAHVCDECKTVAPISEAIGWWKLESIEGLTVIGEKDEYHFCSWPCLSVFGTRHVERLRSIRS